jgi:effector-binding domain-containing protein
MKALKWISLGIVIFMILIIVVAFFLPSHIHVERSVIIKAKPEQLYVLINNLHNWEQWSPWHKRDPEMHILYGDVIEGAGASYFWKSKHPQVGEGSLQIIQSRPYEYIETEMHFGDMGISKATFRFIPSDSGLKVVWSMDTDGKGVPWLMYIPSKYAGLFMDNMLGPEFESGLQSLRTLTEAMPQKETVLGFDIEERELSSTYIISVREKMKHAILGEKIGLAFKRIATYMRAQNMKEAGNPFTLWHGSNTSETDVEIAVPVYAIIDPKGSIHSSELPAVHAFIVQYYGDYKKMPQVYEASHHYITEVKKKEIAGPIREIYITDPGHEPDTSKWLTELAFPVK